MEALENEMDCTRSVARELGLCYVVLYGSLAGGYAGPHSDVDLAVKAGRRLDLVERGRVHSLLSKCWGRRLDVVFLDDSDPIVAWEALGAGMLVYYRDRGCLGEYYDDRARALIMVADLEHLIRVFEGELERAVARYGGKVHEG